MNSIRVLGGTHPDEIMPLALAHSLINKPIDNITATIVNLEAEQQGIRFVDVNMNQGYPGNLASKLYEERRAAAVLHDWTADPAETTFDMHAINGIGEDAAFIGKNGVQPKVLNFLKEIGISKILINDFNCLLQHLPDTVGIESVRGDKRSNVKYWRRAFALFVEEPVLPTASPADFRWFRFADNVHISQADPRSIPVDTAPTDQVPAWLAAKLGHDYPLYWFGRHLEPNAQGYWAELCAPVPAPELSSLG